jgi:hypothetical protein
MNVKIVVGPGFNAAVERQMKRIILDKLNDVRNFMIEEFSQPKSGRIYRRPGGGSYQASAPGEPPAVRTGRLRDSISEPRIAHSGNTVAGEIRIRAPYAGRLEFGRGIAARPFVIPAIEEILRRRV